MNFDYKLIRLQNGEYTVHSTVYKETFHHSIGPVKEAETLYLQQLWLRERIKTATCEFVIWDVGMGAVANPIVILKATENDHCKIRIFSFDKTSRALKFALLHTDKLTYLKGYEIYLTQLIETGETTFTNGRQSVHWKYLECDFPSLIYNCISGNIHNPPDTPDAILFDAYSPAKNPEMWELRLFSSIYKLLNPNHPCSLATYSRSTMLRVTLLLAGFYVGVGSATGEKEETTIASNTIELIEHPLDRRWLLRARRSTSAEPLYAPIYRQTKISRETFEKLLQHPQFSTCTW